MAPSLLLAAAVVAATPCGVGGLRHVAVVGEDSDQHSFLPLCYSSIVAETCALFGGSSVAPRDVAVTLAATSGAVLDLWQTLELEGSQVGAAQEDTCANVCSAVVRFFGELSELPPASDVACYDSEDGRTVCDLDLRPVVIRGLVAPDAQVPDFHDPPLHHRGRKPLPRTAASSRHVQTLRVNGSSVGAEGLAVVNYNTRDLALRVANMFRIYPTFEDGDVLGSRNAAALAQMSAGASSSSAAESADSDSCAGLRKSSCTGQCEWRWSGSWKTSCTLSSPVTTCPGLKKASCRETDGCVWQWSGDSSTSCFQATSTCKGLLKRQCDKDSSCQWTWTGSRNGCVERSQGPARSGAGGEARRAEAEKIGLQAQAYVSTAVRKWRVRQTGPSMKRWFGDASFTDPYMRQEIGRVLNSVAHVLSKADYVFPGKKCREEIYAYVLPAGEGSRSAGGDFIVNLCQLFFDSSPAVQIETLTHEASHHSTALTDDICLDRAPVYLEEALADFGFAGSSIVGKIFGGEAEGQEIEWVQAMLVKGDRVVMRQWSPEEEEQECSDAAYSREICEQLAKDDPILAVRNAENFCFYIQDITDSP